MKSFWSEHNFFRIITSNPFYSLSHCIGRPSYTPLVITMPFCQWNRVGWSSTGWVIHNYTCKKSFSSLPIKTCNQILNWKMICGYIWQAVLQVACFTMPNDIKFHHQSLVEKYNLSFLSRPYFCQPMKNKKAKCSVLIRLYPHATF